jgi:hypothetical protein
MLLHHRVNAHNFVSGNDNDGLGTLHQLVVLEHQRVSEKTSNPKTQTWHLIDFQILFGIANIDDLVQVRLDALLAVLFREKCEKGGTTKNKQTRNLFSHLNELVHAEHVALVRIGEEQQVEEILQDFGNVDQTSSNFSGDVLALDKTKGIGGL